MNSIERKLAFTFTAIALICAFAMPGLASPALAYFSYPLHSEDDEVGSALDYLLSVQAADGSIGGFSVSAWVVMAIAAAGEDPADWKTAPANPSILDYLRENSELLGDEANRPTGYERMILAITAAGEDPCNFGQGHPTYAPSGDYVTPLKSYYDGTQIGDSELLNDDFWGVMALIAAGEDPDSDIVQNTVAFIEDNQNEDGGWSWTVGSDSDVDDTAAVIMALAAAGESPTSSDSMADGLLYLHYEEDDCGGFASFGTLNSASTSWAIDAIVASGEDPTSEDWTWDDNPVDYLLSLQDTDGGFKWKEDSSQNKTWMTAYAIPALLGKPYPVAVHEAPPATQPTIAFSPSSFSFSATEGGADPADKMLKIWNSGPDTLSWQVSDDADWLSLSSGSGSSSGEKDEVTVSVDISGLDEDDYEATITIEAPEADNSPQTVTVSLDIGEPGTEPTIDFTPSSLDFTAAEGGANPADKTLKIWNSGEGTLSWRVSDNADWLTLSPGSGSSTGEKDKVTVSVDSSGKSGGDYEAKISIRDSRASNSPQTLSVSLHVGGSSSYYSLTTTVGPGSNGGSISLSPSQPAGGYPEGTEVELTANPAAGHDFNCWSGDLSGSSNPATVTMNSNRAVTANFVLFDAGDLPNIALEQADPGVTSVSVDCYPIKSLANVPPDLDVQLAYVVDSAGTGHFSLRFGGIFSASSIKVYKVTDNGWVTLESVTTDGNAVGVTLSVGDPTIVFALPSATTGILGSIGKPDAASMIAIVVVMALVTGIALVFCRIRKAA
ncbi:MAG: hypothetical protein KAX25_06825 [Dehalococcoidia bacterium]|nr:hypothetical protein [Dehalococcoidia bacterium]